MNDEPPVDPSNRLHHALIALDQLSRIPSPVLALFIGILGAAIAGLWYVSIEASWISVSAGLAYVLFVAADWTWLVSLSRSGISFGPVKPPLFGLIGLRVVVGLVPLLGQMLGLPALVCCVLGCMLHALVFGTMVYATRFEPFRLGVTRVEIQTPKLPTGRRIRLVQIADLHIERITRRERDLIEQVNALDADFCLYTGDYLNFSYIGEPEAITEARQVLSAIHARHGAYAVRGTHQVDPNALLPTLFAELPIRWLRSEHVTARHDGCAITFAGASCTRAREIDVPAVERALSDVPQDIFTVLLYHTPDLVPEAIAAGADLYLAGHTHGGQIRLPLYGAVMTATEVGKRYEMGRYDVDGLTLYVSRGLGMEGKGAPRARFLCPPEIVCIDVVGTGPVVPTCQN
jgi:predicted MPP superfamily phosphohydrolase